MNDIVPILNEVAHQSTPKARNPRAGGVLEGSTAACYNAGSGRNLAMASLHSAHQKHEMGLGLYIAVRIGVGVAEGLLVCSPGWLRVPERDKLCIC